LPLIAGCSPVLEATRPTPIDLSHFRPGQTHDSVTEEIGTPQGASAEADGASCDSYRLYTHGPGGAGKAGIALLEGAADVFTIGLAEVVLTPTEAATRNQLHPVSFCYKDGKLVKVVESGRTITSSESWGTPDSPQTAVVDPATTVTATATPRATDSASHDTTTAPKPSPAVAPPRS
jgi:hypothetical protein